MGGGGREGKLPGLPGGVRDIKGRKKNKPWLPGIERKRSCRKDYHMREWRSKEREPGGEGKRGEQGIKGEMGIYLCSRRI